MIERLRIKNVKCTGLSIVEELYEDMHLLIARVENIENDEKLQFDTIHGPEKGKNTALSEQY